MVRAREAAGSRGFGECASPGPWMEMNCCCPCMHITRRKLTAWQHGPVQTPVPPIQISML
eukprot:1161012-Pelagomonas_calceolata.AAC.6